MSVIEIIKLIGLVCWLFHQRHHKKLCDLVDADGRSYERRHCLKCQGPSWEVDKDAEE